MMILHMPQICIYNQSDAINPYNATANNIVQLPIIDFHRKFDVDGTNNIVRE